LRIASLNSIRSPRAERQAHRYATSNSRNYHSGSKFRTRRGPYELPSLRHILAASVRDIHPWLVSLLEDGYGLIHDTGEWFAGDGWHMSGRLIDEQHYGASGPPLWTASSAASRSATVFNGTKDQMKGLMYVADKHTAAVLPATATIAAKKK
jgi:hypothetical protein